MNTCKRLVVLLLLLVPVSHAMQNKQRLLELNREEKRKRENLRKAQEEKLPPSGSIIGLECLKQFGDEAHAMKSYDGNQCGYYAAYFASIFAENPNKWHAEQEAQLLDRKRFEKKILKPGRKNIQNTRDSLVVRAKCLKGGKELSRDFLAQLNKQMDEHLPLTDIFGRQIKELITKLTPKLKSDIFVVGDEYVDPDLGPAYDAFVRGDRPQLVYVVPGTMGGGHWFAARVEREGKKLKITYADSMGFDQSNNWFFLTLYNELKHLEQD